MVPKPYLAVGEEHLHVLRTDKRGWTVLLRALHLLASDPAGLGPDSADQQVCDAEEMLVEMDDRSDDTTIRETVRHEREAARDRAVDEMTADILIANLRREHADLVEAAEAEERAIAERNGG